MDNFVFFVSNFEDMIDNFVEDLMKITWYVVMILGC
jgi:hypothetical protein